MNIPTWREWLHSSKALMAALLALYIAMAIPLDNPYWAMSSVYIVSHPLSGATSSKSLYRALGTFLGACASVAIVPPFAHQPVMLSLVIALWVGALFYFSQLDRTPRSYIFMLAAYTVPLIGLSHVNDPETVFNVALARTEEIVLGIVCAAVINAVVFPSRIAPVLGAKMDKLLEDARFLTGRMLSTFDFDEPDQVRLNKTLVDVMSLDAMIVQLSYDEASHLPARYAREFRSRMAMLLPQLGALADPLRRLDRELDGLPEELKELISRVNDWVQGKEGAAVDARQLREHSRHLETWLSESYPAQALLIGGAMDGLRELVTLWQDFQSLRQSFVQGDAVQAPELGYKVRQLVGGPRHFDYGLIAYSAISVGLSVLVGCLAWMNLGWNYGSSGIFMIAVVGCFFSAQDNPAPFIRSFLNCTLVATLAAGIYLFGLMPLIHDFSMLAIALALPLLLSGTLAGRPQFSMAVMLFAVQMVSSITIQDTYKANFPLFADHSLSMILGLIFALVWARVSKPFGAERSTRRLMRSAWRDLADLSELTTLRDLRERDRIAAQMIDRTTQLLPRLSQVNNPQLALTDTIRDLHVCFSLLELRKQKSLSEPLKQQVRPLLKTLHGYYLACAEKRHQLPPPELLRQQLDEALAALAGSSSRSARKAALALSGLSLCLFPEAPSSAAADAPLPPSSGPNPVGAPA